MVARGFDHSAQRRVQGEARGAGRVVAVVIRRDTWPRSNRRTRLVHYADSVIQGVGDVEVANGIHRHVIRIIELGGGGGATVSEIASAAGASHSGNDAGRVHLADALILGVCDVEIPGRVHR